MAETRKRRTTYLVEAPAWGGAEEYVVTLIHLLAHEQDATVVAVQPVPPQLVSALTGCATLVETKAVGSKREVRAMLSLVRTVRRTRPDLVHVNLNSPANNRYGILAAALSGGSSVATVHLPLPLRSRAQRIVLSLLYRAVDGVVVVSEQARRQLVDELGLPVRSVVVIRNGVRPVTLPDVVARPEGCVIGAMGRLVEQKGFDVLLDALRRLHQKGVPVSLRLAGQGEQERELRQASRGLPVHFDGHVDDVPGWFAKLDIFCLPSRSEGLPLALLEAMHAGLPCVASDVGDIRSAVGDAVRLVQPGRPDELVTALLDLCGEPAARLVLGQQASAFATAELSAHEMALRTAEVYGRVMSSVRRR